jgi:hypothetical protein
LPSQILEAIYRASEEKSVMNCSTAANEFTLAARLIAMGFLGSHLSLFRLGLSLVIEASNLRYGAQENFIAWRGYWKSSK